MLMTFLRAAMHQKTKPTLHHVSTACTHVYTLITEQFMLGLLLQVTGQWFSTIGVGFYLYGSAKGGTIGMKHDESGGDAQMALATVSVYMCLHVAAAALVSTLCCIVTNFATLCR
jgi:hypothetical protein